jgi:hypothetical protein
MCAIVNAKNEAKDIVVLLLGRSLSEQQSSVFKKLSGVASLVPGAYAVAF